MTIRIDANDHSIDARGNSRFDGGAKPRETPEQFIARMRAKFVELGMPLPSSATKPTTRAPSQGADQRADAEESVEAHHASVMRRAVEAGRKPLALPAPRADADGALERDSEAQRARVLRETFARAGFGDEDANG